MISEFQGVKTFDKSYPQPNNGACENVGSFMYRIKAYEWDFK